MGALGRATFPLVPRYRLTGLPFGVARSTRRGRGSDTAGFRAYVPGDPISTIDWRASARLSTARGDDEFLVRERYADEAPTVVIVADRRPSMALYPDWSPWLSKPEVGRVAIELIVASALGARSTVGYLDHAARPDGRAGPFWILPRSRSPLESIAARERSAGFTAPPGSLAEGVDYLGRFTASLGAGSFVFVISDFLEPPPREVWLRALARRFELVPVVIQDPTWEQSFPAVGPVIVPVVDPADGKLYEVRLGRSEARAERDRREHARAALLAEFASIGVDPVLPVGHDPDTVSDAFFTWAERRRALLRWR